MTRTLDTVVQVAYVVSDIKAAARFWTTLGVGPIFINRWEMEARYRGSPTTFAADFGFGYSGDLQLELIHQVTDGASPYRGPWEGSFQTLHHLGIYSTDTVGDARQIEANGYPIVFDLESAYGYISYHDTTGQPGGLIELLPAAMFASEPFKRIKAASMNWDGCDPIRDGKELFS